MEKNYTDAEAKALILEIGRRMYSRQLVSSNDGNISIRTGEGRIWLTPSGVSKGFMTEEMLVCVDLSGRVLEGTRKPSSESRMHLRVYRENPAVNAVVHAHPVTATAFAIARVPLDLALMTESVIGLGVVPVAPYATAGTDAVAESVAPYCREYHALLLANHGALTWGEEAMQAYFRMESVEACAQVMLRLGLLDRPARVLTACQRQELLDGRKNFGIRTGGVPRCAEDLEKDRQ